MKSAKGNAGNPKVSLSKVEPEGPGLQMPVPGRLKRNDLAMQSEMDVRWQLNLEQFHKSTDLGQKVQTFGIHRSDRLVW